MKICRKCNIEKPLTDMVKDKRNKDGRSSICSICKSIDNKSWLLDNKEHRKEYMIIYNLKYRELHKEELNEYCRKWSKENREWVNNYCNDRLKNNILFRLSSRYRSYIKKILKRSNIQKNINTQDILGCSFNDFKNHIEIQFEDWMSWENRGLYNGELNYGWDIDHIIPLSSAKCEEDIIKLNHYTNLQPLCSKINRDIKKDNYEKI